jgi:hypothetical protein
MGRRYDNDFRRATVLYWLRGEKPQPEVARELGIPFETLRRWCIDREALLDGTPGDFDHRAVLGLDAVPVVSEVDARQLPMFPALANGSVVSVEACASGVLRNGEPLKVRAGDTVEVGADSDGRAFARVVPLDDPPPSVVDRIAEQQMALYADHPDVVAQAKAFAAQRLADAMATEAEARAAMAKEMLAKVQTERRAMDVRAALDGRDELLAQQTQLLRLAQNLLLGSQGNDPNVVNRVQAVIHLASELRLATRES